MENDCAAQGFQIIASAAGSTGINCKAREQCLQRVHIGQIILHILVFIHSGTSLIVLRRPYITRLPVKVLPVAINIRLVQNIRDMLNHPLSVFLVIQVVQISVHTGMFVYLGEQCPVFLIAEVVYHLFQRHSQKLRFKPEQGLHVIFLAISGNIRHAVFKAIGVHRIGPDIPPARQFASVTVAIPTGIHPDIIHLNAIGNIRTHTVECLALAVE